MHAQAGISTADRLLAVSAGFAEEIQTFLGGWGMEGLLQERASVINGITNGIDME
jgi:starch synthase